MGNFSTKFILKTERGITRLHGQVTMAGRFKVFPVYHPAAALYDPTKQVAIEADFRRLGELLKGGRGVAPGLGCVRDGPWFATARLWLAMRSPNGAFILK